MPNTARPATPTASPHGLLPAATITENRTSPPRRGGRGRADSGQAPPAAPKKKSSVQDFFERLQRPNTPPLAATPPAGSRQIAPRGLGASAMGPHAQVPTTPGGHSLFALCAPTPPRAYRLSRAHQAIAQGDAALLEQALSQMEPDPDALFAEAHVRPDHPLAAEVQDRTVFAQMAWAWVNSSEPVQQVHLRRMLVALFARAMQAPGPATTAQAPEEHGSLTYLRQLVGELAFLPSQPPPYEFVCYCVADLRQAAGQADAAATGADRLFRAVSEFARTLLFAASMRALNDPIQPLTMRATRAHVDALWLGGLQDPAADRAAGELLRHVVACLRQEGLNLYISFRRPPLVRPLAQADETLAPAPASAMGPAGLQVSPVAPYFLRPGSPRTGEGTSHLLRPSSYLEARHSGLFVDEQRFSFAGLSQVLDDNMDLASAAETLPSAFLPPDTTTLWPPAEAAAPQG